MDASRTLVALLLCTLVSSSQAHKIEFPKRDALQLNKDRVVLSMQYVVESSDEANVLRRLFDRDRSGSLDAQEREALLSYLCRQATSFVRLELDGKPLTFSQTGAELGADLASADIILTAPLIEKQSVGRHHLRIFDRHKDRRIAVPLRVFGHDVRILSALTPLTLLDEKHPLELELEVTAQR